MATVKIVKNKVGDNQKLTLFFDGAESQNTFFDNLSGLTMSNVNFAINDGVRTSVDFIPDQDGEIVDLSFYEVLKYNYCIVDLDSGERRFYFIEKIVQEDGNVYRLELFIDVIQTHYIPNRDSCNLYGLINRAHINRFTDAQNNKVYYDFTENSSLLLNVEDSPTIMTERQEFDCKGVSGTSVIDTWLNENVESWTYVFLSREKYSFSWLYSGVPLAYDYDFAAFPYDVYATYKGAESETLESDILVFAYPNYKTTARIYAGNTDESTYVSISNRAEEYFRLTNTGTSYFYCKKLCKTPPINFAKRCKFSTNLNAPYILCDLDPNDSSKYYGLVQDRDDSSEYFGVGVFTASDFGIIFGAEFESQTLVSSDLQEELNDMIHFDVDDIKANSNNYCPVEISSCKLKINDGISEGEEFDISKLSGGSGIVPTFEVYDAPTPNVNPAFIRLKNASGLYNTTYTKNLKMFSNARDTSILYETDSFDSYVSSNKNYFLQFKASQLQSALSLSSKAITDATSMAIDPNVKTGVNSLLGVGEGALDLAFKSRQFKYSVDNMQASKNSLGSSGFNIATDFAIAKLGYFYTIEKPLEIDLQAIFNKYCINGYIVNKKGFVKDFDNIRTKYNHIEITLDVVDMDISQEEKRIMIDKFSSITFINPEIDPNTMYAESNYENGL